ncbi:MAG: aldehyde dehydrogenase [Velocimicrobium sp.]
MEELVRKQREFYNSNQTKSVEFRKAALKRLSESIERNEAFIYNALKQDLNKSETESYLAEIQIVKTEIKTALRHLNSWQRKKRVKTPITHFPAASYIYHDPYGVVLILSPWNYPFQLALAPLVGAVAAGNCVVLKVSKSSEHVSQIIRKIVDEAFEMNHVCCVDYQVDYEEILNQIYDFIFFTGSEAIGKKVMAAASKNVTPLVLELGGKSPCIIEKTADIPLAAKRLAWGKYLNAGQTCVAPDYVLIDKSRKNEFVKELQVQIKNMYGEALQNEAYPKIINQHHYERLMALIQAEPAKIGGRGREETGQIEPTIFTDASFEDEIMREEIFGPILPVISYSSLKEVLTLLKAKPRPLAFYLFSNNQRRIEAVLRYSEFGGGCVNDVIMHLANHNLPFGGLGSSGMGNYHGVYSFDTFTHQKAVLKSKVFLDVPLRYPPYTEKKLELVRKITH